MWGGVWEEIPKSQISVALLNSGGEGDRREPVFLNAGSTLNTLRSNGLTVYDAS